jgi:hypothetical protein
MGGYDATYSQRPLEAIPSSGEAEKARLFAVRPAISVGGSA